MKTKNIILLTFTFLTLSTEQIFAFSRGKPFWEKRSTPSNSAQHAPVQTPVTPTPTTSAPPIVSQTPPVVVPTPAPTPAPAPVSGYQEGDIIFIQSQSSQSAALREATGSVWTHVGLLVKQNSKWYVAEAVGPVVSTPMSEFIARSKDKAYEIYRFRHFDPTTMRSAMLAAIQKYNKPYDIYFEFSDTRTYCSELTYKVMLDVTGQGLGRVQKMRDMKLDGPYVKALVQKRLTDIGKELNLDEDIITPVSQMLDPDVTLIEKKD
ncbi:YiiX/YebB-like N1pC/P60 family cysteine hydrolase [Pseudobdellovibrio sp. HCB154]|uniref:YiiX/YebB-like N1pC/P60 family cysteine hydrolase n=1 Tax=Pseudobdellovibrio sp. HCB154 TaxID=3386277 RepID=UPI00391755A8